ncbi:MAG TPA: hypothetical protein VJK07_04575 [Candidatus Nanoarchaeia archaeon]|nr:hypothetical protein [Candidatus Nanoarchaeia archaeon]
MAVRLSRRIKYKLRHYPERASPTFWPFIIAVLLVSIGSGISSLRILAWVGLFIMGIYVLVWIVWLISQIES